MDFQVFFSFLLLPLIIKKKKKKKENLLSLPYYITGYFPDWYFGIFLFRAKAEWHPERN